MQRIYIFLTLILLIASASGKEVSPSDEYFNLVGKADKSISAMKWDEAIEYLNAAMRLEPANPSNVLLMSNLGMVYHYSGEDSLAIATLTTARQIAPASVTVLSNRAKVLTAIGRLDEALDDYAEVIRRDSTLVEPRFYQAMISLRAADLNTCRQSIEDMKRLFPDETATLLAEATYLSFTGAYAEAIPLLGIIIERTPTAADYGTRALCYLMTDQLPEAAEDIAKGLELDPTDGDLYFYRAMLNKARFRPDDARADAEKARYFGVASERIKSLGLINK